MTRFIVAFMLMGLADAWGQSAGVGADRIGHATMTRGRVDSYVQGRAYPLSQYGPVYYEQWVNTGATPSQAELRFLDESHFSVGPVSHVRLGKEVYDPARRIRVVNIHVRDGSFQLVKSKTDPRMYAVHTPYATIGVAGTVVEIVVKHPRRKGRK